ncbi:unnamed protein product [Bursaphelenchus okinawaensis]|uniref:Protein phosphatase n=1 Tax=Bursaphelenchus okinawaensis TaxID=465554 RepID=A0A811KB47_9BILA|nr:unnamed protein product [Bursaphelenchus okinawaensis]CAG9100693.1 unnamed protein product [Bursaphelenchus okinawaensis]
MLTYGRLLIRVAVPHGKDISNIRPVAFAKNFCSTARTTAATSTDSAATNATKTAQKVDSSCCGFAKDLIGGPSTVLDHGKFGEDACFVTHFKHTHVAGVADGVGGWRKYGIDPSEFSSNLMKHCEKIVEAGEFKPDRPDLIISKAFERLAVSPRPIGSSTACVVVIHQHTLYTANLGDSGYLVYRDGKVVQKSTEQVHYFNAPFQLTLLPEQCELEGFIRDTPENSDLNVLDLEKGDVVLLATDGLWDNVPDALICEALEGVNAQNLQQKCNTIALIARRLSCDVHHLSPFAKKASEHGIRTKGGKQDDITCVLLYIS